MHLCTFLIYLFFKKLLFIYPRSSCESSTSVVAVRWHATVAHSVSRGIGRPIRSSAANARGSWPWSPSLSGDPLSPRHSQMGSEGGLWDGTCKEMQKWQWGEKKSTDWLTEWAIMLVGEAGLLSAGWEGHEKPFFSSQTLAFPWLVMGGFFF